MTTGAVSRKKTVTIASNTDAWTKEKPQQPVNPLGRVEVPIYGLYRRVNIRLTQRHAASSVVSFRAWLYVQFSFNRMTCPFIVGIDSFISEATIDRTDGGLFAVCRRRYYHQSFPQ